MRWRDMRLPARRRPEVRSPWDCPKDGAGYKHVVHHEPWLDRMVAYESRFTVVLLVVLVIGELLFLIDRI
jgi:hypothetical protein